MFQNDLLSLKVSLRMDPTDTEPRLWSTMRPSICILLIMDCLVMIPSLWARWIHWYLRAFAETVLTDYWHYTQCYIHLWTCRINIRVEPIQKEVDDLKTEMRVRMRGLHQLGLADQLLLIQNNYRAVTPPDVPLNQFNRSNTTCQANELNWKDNDSKPWWWRSYWQELFQITHREVGLKDF